MLVSESLVLDLQKEWACWVWWNNAVVYFDASGHHGQVQAKVSQALKLNNNLENSNSNAHRSMSSSLG